MNKEAMRKLLEDCWDAGVKRAYVDDFGPVPNKNPDRDTYITSQLSAMSEDDGQEGNGLFRSGKFTLHSGQESDFIIDCDALSDSDLEALAFQIWQHRTFGEVYGVPKGGERIAEKLRRYIIEDSSVLLIVDDVMTTGNSMNEAYEKFKTKYDHIDGAVIFNRGANLPCVYSIFTTPALPVADGEGEKGSGSDLGTPHEIVDENFKGLDELIEDNDLREWYKDLIVTCIEEYHASKSPFPPPCTRQKINSI